MVHAPRTPRLSLLDFELLHVGAGKHAVWKSIDFEAVAVLIQGTCMFVVGDITKEVRRNSVFTDNASAVFISPGITLEIKTSTNTTIALCKARANKRFQTTFIDPEAITRELRGGLGFKRQVFNIVNIETQTERIAVGETINESGEWSSFPPHKHDEYVKSEGKMLEVPLEEIYYYKIESETGFAFQRLYSNDGSIDEAYVVKDGDITHIPCGYHPVANIPGHRLYYLWMLAGEQRTYIWNTDPAFKFLEKK